MSRILRPTTSLFRRNISVQAILHGSPEAKQAGDIELQQHSRLVARGKYVHAFEYHRVKPEYAEQYKAAAEKYYTGIRSDPDLRIKLTGSWEVTIGDMDTYVHITEYENYSGYDRSSKLIQDSEHSKVYKEMIPFLNSRTSQLNQEFAFLPAAAPRDEGGIFELRTYQLEPGKLLEWETAWRSGIEARRKYVKPVGAWFSQVGRLHQVHHLWQHEGLGPRKETREKAWQEDGWSDTVVKTSKLAKFMDANILVALPFSPLK